MSRRNWILGLGTLSLVGLLTFNSPRINADPAEGEQASGSAEEQEAGVDVQGRGPVHEAFAEPGTAPRAAPVVAKKPPDPVEEVPPDQKPEGDNIQWIPGYWAFDSESTDYMWVSGVWRTFPPGRTWTPGHWAEVTEGYQWAPGYWADAQQQETDLVPPPPATIDNGPSAPAPSADSVYVTGTWVYQTRRFVWRPGFWYVPRPTWVWEPAHYVWTPGGCIFVDGYWDYPLQTRGLLFAPVVIEQRLLLRRGWVYRPRFVVYETALLGSLFVRPDTGCYYFGDYFEPRYRRLGFVAWVDFRATRYSPDPLFSYYRWQNRRDRRWETSLTTLYRDRFNGRAVRPPRTFVQQNKVINNITVNNTVNITNIRNVTVLAPLTRVDRSVIKLQQVSPARLAQERKAVTQFRAISSQRQKITAQVLAKGSAPVKSTDVPRVAKFQLPRPVAAVKTKVVVRPPAPPVKSVVKPGPKTEVKPVIKPTPRPLPKTEVKPIIKPTPRPLPRTEVKPVTKPQPRPVVKPTPQPRTEVKPVTRPVIKPTPKPLPRTEVKPITRPSTQPVIKPVPRTNSPAQPRTNVKSGVTAPRQVVKAPTQPQRVQPRPAPVSHPATKTSVRPVTQQRK